MNYKLQTKKYKIYSNTYKVQPTDNNKSGWKHANTGCTTAGTYSS